MELFLLIRTENTDASFSLITPFKTLADAQFDLKQKYEEEINEREHDDLCKMIYDEDLCYAFIEDIKGIVIHWSIKVISV